VNDGDRDVVALIRASADRFARGFSFVSSATAAAMPSAFFRASYGGLRARARWLAAALYERAPTRARIAVLLENCCERRHRVGLCHFGARLGRAERQNSVTEVQRIVDVARPTR
jgi:hypothetical protein